MFSRLLGKNETVDPNESVNIDGVYGGALPLDDLFHVLSVERRRYVMRYLNFVEPAVSLRDIAVSRAAAENDIDESDVGYRERKRTYVSLYQSHLPVLDDYGLLDFDERAGNIVLLPEGGHLAPLL